MTVICEDDVIASVADALQYISYYHSADFIRAMGRAYAAEPKVIGRYARTRASWWCSSRSAWAFAGGRTATWRE
jgi:hypothetical protein